MDSTQSPPVSVLQVLSQDDFGGTELMLASLIERLDPRRVRSELVVFSAPGPICARLGAAGIKVHALGGGSWPSAALGLARLLRAGRYDVVAAYGLRAGLATRFIARVFAPRTRVVVGIRGLLVTEVERLDSRKARLVLWLERLTSRLVDLYDSNSRGGAELIISTGIDPERVRYIPNGLDIGRWATPNGRASGEGPPSIACIARFTPIKRHQDLLRALALLKGEGVPFRAVLAGAGPTLERSRLLATKLGLADQVEFPGQIDPHQVRDLLGRSDLACLASIWEGMPGFIMEAMATGLPVVATSVSGSDELVVDGETGFLVPPQDPPALMQALRRLLDRPALAAQLGKAGRNRIERNFTLDSMVSAKQRLYEGVVTG